MRCNGNSHSPDNIQTVRMSARGGSEQKIYSIARANGTATSQLSALIFYVRFRPLGRVPRARARCGRLWPTRSVQRACEDGGLDGSLLG